MIVEGVEGREDKLNCIRNQVKKIPNDSVISFVFLQVNFQWRSYDLEKNAFQNNALNLFINFSQLITYELFAECAGYLWVNICTDIWSSQVIWYYTIGFMQDHHRIS